MRLPCTNLERQAIDQGKMLKLAACAPIETESTFFQGMAMKVEQSTQPSNTQLIKETRGPSVKKTESAPVEVELSSLASQLLGADDGLPFDAGRVAEIKRAISEGKFPINADAIADRLITSARELVGSRHQS
jgi:negative regulator of flagellin synthesis FlgM